MKNSYSFRIFLALCIFFILEISAQNKDKERNIEGITIKKQKKYRNKKENPAYAIMQKVWQKKRNNSLNQFDTYQYKEYEKIQFDFANIDSSFVKKKIFNKLDFVFSYADSTGNGQLSLPFFLNEAVYETSGQNNPTKRQKRLMVAQKTAGFKDNEIITTAAKNLYRDIDIYENTINYFDIGFQSPVGEFGFSTYDYELMDTLTVNGEDSFRIKYQPKRKDVLAFQGYLYISSKNYAVVKASLKSTKKMNVNFINGVSTDLEFDNSADNTYLIKKLRTTVELSPFSKKRDSKSIVASRYVEYDDYRFNIPISEETFIEKEEELTEAFVLKDDSYWKMMRKDSLDRKEKGIYEMMDILNKTPRFKNIITLTETLTTGYYNVGKIGIGNLHTIYGYNKIEGHRIRLAARTFLSKNDMWRVQGYGAYGFRDRQFKYGVDARWMFGKVHRFTIGASTGRDILQLGSRLMKDDGVVGNTFGASSLIRRGDNPNLSSVNQTSLFTSVDVVKNVTVKLAGTMQSIHSANPSEFSLNYYDDDGDFRKTTNDSRISLSVTANLGAKFSRSGIDRRKHRTLASTTTIKYTKGIKGLFGSDFGYSKLQFLYNQPILVGSWGRSIVHFEAGKTFNPVPLSLQDIIPANQSYGLEKNTFSQLNFYEFVTDAYATTHWEHHFNGKIFSFIPFIKKLGLREVIFLRGAYGDLSNASRAKIINANNYFTPNKSIYYEYGFGIENIGLGNLRFFRIDFNWRGNYLHLPNAPKFGIKLGMQYNY